jgi:hypothetical protein
MKTVALMMFGRGLWVREDALRDAYRGALDDFMGEIDKSAVAENPLATAETVIDRLERELIRDKGVRRWRRRIHNIWAADVREAAARAAREKGRTRPTKDDLARAREKHEHPENTFRSALVCVVHIFLTGEPSYEDALREFLDAIGATAIAQDYAGLDRDQAHAPIIELLVRILGCISVPSLRRLIDDVDIAELIQGRDRALTLTHTLTGRYPEMAADGRTERISLLALGSAAVQRALGPADSQLLDIALYALESKSAPRPRQRPGATARGEPAPHAAQHATARRRAGRGRPQKASAG